MDIEKNIPSDDPVRLLSAFVEGMELLDLYNTYGKIKKDQVSPRQLLKSWSYSVKEVADLLDVDDYLVYELLKKNQMEAVIVDYWKQIPKESFQNWYKSQSRYRTKEDREKDALLEDATITMPEMAELLGTIRSSVYTILDNPKYSHFLNSL